MMHYPSFIYLQNEKTGCSFVEKFLLLFCNERLIEHRKHASLAKNPGKFCFINVRDPVDQYRSLYAFGLDGRGAIYARMKLLGNASLYSRGQEGFEEWLAFVTDPRNSEALAPAYRNSVAGMVGFMTWRFLRLACPGFEAAALKWSDRRQLTDYMAKNTAVGAVLRTETLPQDLKTLVRERLSDMIDDHEGAMEWIDETGPINAAKTDSSSIEISDDALRLIIRREGIICRNFYPDRVAQFERLGQT